MTKNELDFQSLKEVQKHNRATEALGVLEHAERVRSNRAGESLTGARDQQTAAHYLRMDQLGRDQLAETIRNNLQLASDKWGMHAQDNQVAIIQAIMKELGPLGVVYGQDYLSTNYGSAGDAGGIKRPLREEAGASGKVGSNQEGTVATGTLSGGLQYRTEGGTTKTTGKAYPNQREADKNSDYRVPRAPGTGTAYTTSGTKVITKPAISGQQIKGPAPSKIDKLADKMSKLGR